MSKDQTTNAERTTEESGNEHHHHHHLHLHRPSPWTIALVSMVAAVALAVGVTLTTRASRDHSAPPPPIAPTSQGPQVPSGVGPAGEILVGSQQAPARLDLYYDYGCAACGTLDKQLRPTLDKLIADRTVLVAYHPIPAAMSGGQPPSEYSRQAVGGAYCVVQKWPQAFTAYNSSVFTTDPKVLADPRPDTSPLVNAAVAAGTQPTVHGCIAGSIFVPFGNAQGDRAVREGFGQVPSLVLNGQQVPSHLWTPTGLEDAILVAAGKKTLATGSATTSTTSGTPSTGTSPTP